MTKKEYILIATAIRDEKEGSSSLDTVLALRNVVNVLIPIMSKDNPRFDSAKFVEACGLARYCRVVPCLELEINKFDAEYASYPKCPIAIALQSIVGKK